MNLRQKAISGIFWTVSEILIWMLVISNAGPQLIIDSGFACALTIYGK